MTSTDKCFVCNEDIDENSDEVSRVTEKGIASLETASRARGDHKSCQLIGLKTMLIHKVCRKLYTRPQSIVAAKKRQATTSTQPMSSGKLQPIFLRSSQPPFDFKANCFLCSKPSSLETSKKLTLKRRRKVYSVSNMDKDLFCVQTQCMTAGHVRNDKWGKEVVLRLSGDIDLVAEEAIYHNDCYKSFTRVVYQDKKSTETDDYVYKGMEEIYSYMEEKHDIQFTAEELMNVVTGKKLDWRTVKSKLIEKYEDRVIVKPGCNRFNVPVICFRDVGYKVLNDAWYEQERKKVDADERLRIVKTAAAIIRQDIQSEVYDSCTYPSGDNFFQNIDCVTPTLRTFLQEVMMKNSKRVEETNKKCITIGHAITSIVRPRSFISPVLNGLSLFIHRRFASRTLINILASMGFCSSYYEAQLLEMSCIANVKPVVKEGSFSQFVFDNADFNVCTIDGLNTFHSMGGIRCITPSSSVDQGPRIPRCKKMPLSSETGKVGIIPLETVQPKIGGLRNVFVEDMVVPEELKDPTPQDALFLLGQKQQVKIPQWKGYMNTLTKGVYSEKTKIVPLPLINAPPSNYNTVFTALRYAADSCDKLNQQTMIVTFDQPLYWKAREIVASAPADSRISKCIVRLGGFHVLMSYLGCIGYLMDGSGLKELLSTVYASNSVDKMLQGHAFARAVRGHLLAQTALSNIVLDSVEITKEEHESASEILSSLWDDPPSIEGIRGNHFVLSIAKKIGQALSNLCQNGKTAKLWVQYFQMVTLMKEYIHAERSGNWDAHIACVKKMLPYFHSSGHFNYAKSCHLYIQDMAELSSKLTPAEYNQFVNDGAFTMRHSDRAWSGLWSDMTIETYLMRSFSAQGGIKRGRGVSDSVISKWVVGMSATHNICVSLEEFCGVFFASSEQHKDFSEARISKDMSDITKLTTWLENHPPFPETNDIMSIVSGVIGDESVNCYDAVIQGKKAMNTMLTLPFSDVKLSRKNRAIPLSSVSSSIKIHDETVVVQPLLLFQRICISKKSDEDLQDCFRFELAPFPLALFNENGMRKTRKSVLFKLFKPIDDSVDLTNLNLVIDGGFLIHKVVWQKGSSVSTVCDGYLRYVKSHYPGKHCTIVFDGYSNSSDSTKTAEQERRYRLKKSVDIHLKMDTEITVNQEQFLSNKTNKDSLIKMLKSKLQQNGIMTLQASDDADVLIVNTAIEQSMEGTSSVAVIGEDVDLAVLLLAKTSTQRNILFIKPGRGNVQTNVYSTQQMQQLGLDGIMFIHAFTGCDSTSAAFRKSKLGLINLYKKCPEIQEISKVFHNSSSSHDAIEEAGRSCMLKWYGAPAKECSLNDYRYNSFLKSVSNSKPDLASLPPSEGATKQHSFRAFHQVQLWLGNALPPEAWGWKRKNNYLVPVLTTEPPAPREILDLIFCKCTKDCTNSRCTCHKLSINCSQLCRNCKGNCFNGVPILVNEEDDEDMDRTLARTENAHEWDEKNEHDDQSLFLLMPPAVEEENGPPRPKKARP